MTRPATQVAGLDEAYLALLGRLASPLRHDARGPLNGLTLHLEVLRELCRDVAGTSDSLAAMSRDLDRMQRLVDAMAELLAPAEDGETDSGALLERLAPVVETAAQKRGVTIVIPAAAAAAPRCGRPSLVWRCLLIAAMSVIEAAAEGAIVSLSWDAARETLEIGAGGPPTAGLGPTVNLLERALAPDGGAESRPGGLALRLPPADDAR